MKTTFEKISNMTLREILMDINVLEDEILKLLTDPEYHIAKVKELSQSDSKQKNIAS